jgi:hypothetical protein
MLLAGSSDSYAASYKDLHMGVVKAPVCNHKYLVAGAKLSTSKLVP